MIRSVAAVETAEDVDPVASCVREGLLRSSKTLPPWLFYDEAGSALFESITRLPEYYLTRIEGALFKQHAAEIIAQLHAPITMVELGAGTATKTGILLRAAAAAQGRVVYQPVDVSASALNEARNNIESAIAGADVRPVLANYVIHPVQIERPENGTVLALYIGSSVGNFSPDEANQVLLNLRAQMRRGDGLLLGTDMAPGPQKSIESLLSAYDDAAGVTAEFNLNVLVRLNRDLGSDFDLGRFRHSARWNPQDSRIEMHLESIGAQTVYVPSNEAGASFRVHFAAGETIHTENSYKFTRQSIARMLDRAGFSANVTYEDELQQFAVTLARVV